MPIRSNKQKNGFSLIEVLVSSALLGIISLAIAGYIAQVKKMSRQEKLMSFQSDFVLNIEDALSVNSLCSEMLQDGAVTIPGSVTANANQTKKELLTSAFVDRLKHPFFKFSKVELSYRVDNVVDTTSASTSATYIGNLTFTIDFADNKFDSYKSILKQVAVPVILYDSNKSNTWNNIRCATGRSEDSYVVGQICNLYGGTLTDGMKCDFFRNQRANFAGTTTGIKKPDQSSTNISKRIAMEDIVCYLDTLIIMAPKNSLYPNPRNTTRFCKYPGSSSPKPLVISKDIRSIFNEL